MKEKKFNFQPKADRPLDEKRRKFLKLALFSTGSFLLGGIITRLSGIGEDPTKNAVSLRKFKVLEKDDQLIFYSSNGHRLFTVSDDGSMEIS